MKKLLLGAAVLGMMMSAGSIAARAEYAAIAIGGNGWGWADGYSTMERARAEAKRQCRSMGGSCEATVAEQSGWYYSAGYCDGMPYAGTSPQGWWRSDEIVAWKGSRDGNYNCSIEVQR